MDTDNSSSRECISPPLRLDRLARKALQGAFVEKFQQVRPNCSPQQCEDEAEVFVRTLEAYAKGISELQEVSPPEQKRRREKVQALAVALENLHTAIQQVDSAALGFAVWRGLEEVEAKKLGVNPLHPGMSAIFSAASLREEISPELAAFSCGVRFAIKELPPCDFNFSLSTTLAVERTFFESGIPFTVSDSGFAAQCLRAVFQLGGLKGGRVDYWLTLARDSDESTGALIIEPASMNLNQAA